MPCFSDEGMYPFCRILFIRDTSIWGTHCGACFRCSADIPKGSWALCTLNDLIMVLISFKVTGSKASSCWRAMNSINTFYGSEGADQQNLLEQDSIDFIFE